MNHQNVKHIPTLPLTPPPPALPQNPRLCPHGRWPLDPRASKHDLGILDAPPLAALARPAVFIK